MIGKWTNWWKVERWGTELDSKCEKKITNKSRQKVDNLVKVENFCLPETKF